MRTLSICQPWASLLAEGVKPIELRGWSTRYRGQVLVRASKNVMPWHDDSNQRVRVPTNCLLFVGELVSVKPMECPDMVGAMSFYSNDEFSWIIQPHYYVKPVPASGKLKLYETPDELVERLSEEDIRKYHPALNHRRKHPFRAYVVKGELLVMNKLGNQIYYNTHLSHEPPLAWVFVPMFAYIGGIRGGSTCITLKELADAINQGNCYLCVDELPQRQGKQGEVCE